MIDTQLCAHGQENHIKRKEEHLTVTGQYLEETITISVREGQIYEFLEWSEKPTRDVSLEFPVTPMLEKVERVK